jgi:hypothetical protein
MKDFTKFQSRIDRELLQHPIIVCNDYTNWFESGDLDIHQIKDFVIQFSVFSNQFLIAQMNKMINANTIESMRESKEILVNELGVSFDEDTVEGSTFRFGSAHFEWLYTLSKELGLSFNSIGHRSHGTESTLFFCDELIRLYGGSSYSISQASSYAVENWAAAGFWKQLISGFKNYNERSGSLLPLGFFTFHDILEDKHAAHTQVELRELYDTTIIDEDEFIYYGNEMLNGVQSFWNGLETQRLARKYNRSNLLGVGRFRNNIKNIVHN